MLTQVEFHFSLKNASIEGFYIIKTLQSVDENMPQVIYNSHYGNGAPAMFTSQYYLKLKGKHCRKPHYRNGVVDHLGLC